MLTSGWLKNLIDRNISQYEERVRADPKAAPKAREEILATVLDEDTRKEVEQKLHLNGGSQTKN